MAHMHANVEFAQKVALASRLGELVVEGAGLERVGPGRVFGLGDDDLLDARLLAFEVARVVRVDGQGRLQGALVERDKVERGLHRR